MYNLFRIFNFQRFGSLTFDKKEKHIFHSREQHNIIITNKEFILYNVRKLIIKYATKRCFLSLPISCLNGGTNRRRAVVTKRRNTIPYCTLFYFQKGV